MTSVNSYGEATTAGNFTLVHSGTALGLWIDAWNTKARRLTEIAERQNFWSQQVILDGSYPALAWDHSFTVYSEANSLNTYINSYVALANRIQSRAYPLEIWSGTSTPVVWYFGNCYLKDFGQEEPKDLMLHAAGMIRLNFVGTVIPSLVTP